MTTNGGSMSLINMVFAYVNRGRKLGIKNPELIVSITAHAAIEKACELFGVKCIKVPLDDKYQIDLNLVEIPNRFEFSREKYLKKYHMFIRLFSQLPPLYRR